MAGETMQYKRTVKGSVGAGIGGNLSANYGIHMIWVSCGLLIVSFLLMFLDIEARRSRA